jgi:hypothetical protein
MVLSKTDLGCHKVYENSQRIAGAACIYTLNN